jgi:hypothetical protein
MSRVDWQEAMFSVAYGTQAYCFGECVVILSDPSTKLTWSIRFKGHEIRRAHGAFEGVRRFKPAENAMRWAEKHLLKTGGRK